MYRSITRRVIETIDPRTIDPRTIDPRTIDTRTIDPRVENVFHRSVEHLRKL